MVRDELGLDSAHHPSDKTSQGPQPELLGTAVPHISHTHTPHTTHHTQNRTKEDDTA